MLFLIGTLGKVAYANEFNFSVNPVLPENQIGDSGYFNLKMSPGTSQTLTVTLKNSTEKTVVVEQSIASATTNINGVVEYSPNSIKPDSSLKYNITDHAQIRKEISLSPKSSQQVKIQVKMPKTAFNGVMAGGITFKEKDSDTKGSSSKGLSIQNKYAYVVALLIQQNTTNIDPKLQLNSVGPGQVNYQNVINANLQNPVSTYLNQMYVEAKVDGIDNTKLTYSSNKERLQMAPNSNFDYPIAIGDGGKLEAGKYALNMTVYGQKDDNGKYTLKDASGKQIKFKYQWKFKKEFTITGDTASKLNAKDVTVKAEPWYKNWLLWLGILILLLALFILFFILWKRRKDDDDKDEENGDKAQAEISDLKSQLAKIKSQLNNENHNEK